MIPRGFGGSSADDLDYYLDRIVLKYAPRAVAIYEGDTDTGNGQPAAYVAAKLQQIVTRIRTALPETRVYIISVKPSPMRWQYWPVVQQLNQTMQDYCAHPARNAPTSTSQRRYWMQTASSCRSITTPTGFTSARRVTRYGPESSDLH